MLNVKPNEAITNFFLNKFSSSNNIIETKDIETIKKLKDKGYKIILFSNNCCLNENGQIKELLNIIDGVFYSYDLGYTKSEEESYRLIENRLNCDKSDFLHIGDTLTSDYLCPIKYGWQAIFYGNCVDKNIKSINSLKELLKLL